MKKNEHLESRIRLEHVIEAIDVIESFVKDETLLSFCENSLVNNAILFQFSVIGEAINHVEQIKLEKYDYPWHKVRSFRNLIAHEYFNIKLGAVWIIIETELPKLRLIINEMLRNEF